jgi:Kef-type K+ transport system membrane component KefB/Trk K+ transport system NAD-binding subunit
MILLIATLLGLVARALRQPLILAYIITGIIASPLFLGLMKTPETISIFSDFGVAFLLFMIGLNVNSRVLKEVGFVSLVTGAGQVIFSFIIGYLIAIFLGFPMLAAIYISISLAFSSTIIIVKLLMDKNDLESLYGRITVGILLVQDFMAIGIMLVLTNVGTSIPLNYILVYSLIKGSALIALVLFFNRLIFPRIFERIAKSQELLFLSGISWCFVLSYISYYLGFSIGIGAFIAGVSLATIPYHYELGGRIKPLRDFFLVLFFVVLGSQMTFSDINIIITPAIVLSVFVLVCQPVIVMLLIGMLGYKKRTGLLCGLAIAQISEFSLVIVAMGLKLGHINTQVSSLVTVVGIITIAVSSYMIIYNDKIYHKLSRYLPDFGKGRRKKDDISQKDERKKYDAILIGCHRMGYNILKNLREKEFEILVVDYNPEIIKRLKSDGVPCIYADVSDPDIVDKIKEFWPKILISTIPDVDDNLMLINKIKEHDKDVLTIMTSNNVDDALELYQAGADYVVLPHFLGGERVTSLLERFMKAKREQITDFKNAHVFELKRQRKITGR